MAQFLTATNSNLSELTLYSTQVTPRGVKEIKQALPRLTILFIDRVAAGLESSLWHCRRCRVDRPQIT